MCGELSRILLVEDDDGDAALLERAIQRGSIRYDLIRVDRLEAGLEYLRSHNVAVIVTDLGLPDCRGLEAVSRLRSINDTATIVVLSGLEDSATQIAALDHGAQDYLTKSEISSFTLERAIAHGTRRLENERRVLDLLDAVNLQKSQLEEQARLLRLRNRRLRKLYKTAQQFVNNVSHDFRTPLTVVREYGALIADGLVGEVQPEQVRMLRVMGDRVDDLNNMVDDMLDVSRHNSGLLAANRKVCGIDELIADVLPGMNHKASLRGIHLETELPDALPQVFCDPDKAVRVMVNLVTNAIKFTNSGGTVVVSAQSSSRNGEVQISVSDNGPGISEEDCKVIFARFQQAKRGLQNTTKGFGLGLSIAKEFVELNLGRMSLESKLGHGSTFSFSIPVYDLLEVTKRYLERSNTVTRGRAQVSVIHVRADLQQGQERRDVCEFLSSFHRSRQLVLDVGENEWLMLSCLKGDRVPKLLERAQQEWNNLNRNRPSGPLPPVEFQYLGTYRAADSNGEIARIVGQHLSPNAGACCV